MDRLWFVALMDELVDERVCVCVCVCLCVFIYVLGVDRLSAWPIIGADIKHFTDYRYRPFSKQVCR